MDNQHLNRSNQSGLAAFKASLFFKIIDWCLIYSMVFLCITVDTLAYHNNVQAAELPPNTELTQLIQVGSSTQTSVKRITRSDFDFTYTLNISYIGATPIHQVKGHLISLSPSTQIIDADIDFGNMTPGQTLTGKDTYTIRQDRSKPFDPTGLKWSFTYNQAPLANAGSDQSVPVGAEVLLDGTGSTDADGDSLTYRWTFSARPNGSVATLDNIAAPKPHFIVDRAGRYVLSLIVNDGNQDGSAGIVVIDTENSKPFADAGPDQTVATGGTVYLNGSASRDPDGDQLQYTWTLQESPENSNAELNFAGSANPFFTATKAGRYVVHLVVSDGKLDSEADLVVVSTRNSAPVADAGPDQNTTLGDPALTLHGGNSSDVDGQTLSYRWAILNAPDGSTAVIDPFNAAEPGFKPDLAGLYVVQLIVNDGELDSVPDTAQITVASPPPPPNQAPKITTSPRTTGTVGQLYSYDVDATDPDISDILGYSLQVSGPGMIIDSVSGFISWTPTEAGDFEITAKVQDQGGLSDTQNYTLKISAAPPVNRAPQITSTPVTTATAGQLYSYDVDATDPDGDALTYALTQSPEGMSIDNITGLIQWTPPVGNNQAPSVTVIATDSGGLNAEQGFTISVSIPNQLPQAQNDSFEADLTQPLIIAAPGVLTNDSDADQDPLTAILQTPPTNGSVDLKPDGGFTFTPNVLPPGEPLQVKLKWAWTAPTTLPDSVNVINSPAVIDLNEDATPDIVFGSISSRSGGYIEPGYLRAINGKTGAELFTVTSRSINVASSVAVGDIDGDNRPEIVACDSSGDRIVVFEHDGTFKWQGPQLERIAWGSPALADLDQDGVLEIVIGRQVLNNNGAILWSGTGGRASTSTYNLGPLSVVSDIDLDGSPDILAGNTVYRFDGQIKWQKVIPDGFNAVGNFDADSQAEVVLVSNGSVYLLEHDGTTIWGPQPIPGGGHGGTPTIADFDGDGAPEIGVAGATRYVVFETDGSVKWQSITQDSSSNVTGSTVFDFEGDGTAEVIYRDELKLRVYKGSDGTVLFQTSLSSGTYYEYPLVADVDADGHAEIIVGANEHPGFGSQHGLYVFADQNNRWVATRKIWNQHSYHITNVNEDGTIPRQEAVNWLLPSLNNFRLNSFGPRDTALTDSFTYKASDGKGESKLATVNLTAKRPNQSPVITSTSVTTGKVGEVYSYDVDAFDPDPQDTLTFALGQHPDGMSINQATGLISWTPTDAQAGSQAVTVSVTDSGGLSENQSYAVTVSVPLPPNRAPVAQDETFSTAGTVLQQPAPGVLANDSDPDGDMIIALLLSGSANGTVNLSPDGSLTYTPNAGFVGTDTFTYKASDGKLDSNLATVTINVTKANQPPVITSTPNTSHWIQLNPNGTKPLARYSATQRTYDEFNDRLIVFGGLDSNSQRSLNDVWVLANASGLTGIPEWQKLEPTGTKPANRAGFVSAYDPTANRLIVYSGCTGFCASVSDAWVLTHANGLGGNPEWLSLPAGRVMGFGTGDYDPVTNRLVVFGGLPGGPGSDWSKLQILEDANGIGNPRWTELNPTGPLPPPRGHDQPGVYDPLSNTFILFGGITSGPSNTGYNDVWVLSHANGVGGTTAWTELHPVGTAPPPGFHHMTYDPNSARLIVYGGQEYPPGNAGQRFNDVWVLTHANGQNGVPEWLHLNPSDASSVYNTPTIGYAKASNRLISALGYTKEGFATNEAWVLTNASGNCTANQPCDYDVEASDADAGDVLSYALLQGPAGMTIEAGTGQLHWTPGAAQTGTHDVTVKVMDAGGLSATQSFQFTVSPVAVPNMQGLAPEWAEAMLQAAGLSTGAKSSLGGAITLNFDTLPSEQGWSFLGSNFGGTEQMFSISNGVLKQDTTSAGGDPEAMYTLKAVNPRLPFELLAKSRVIAGGLVGVGHYAFARGEIFSFFLNPQAVLLHGQSWITAANQDNTVFHDYLLDGYPGGQFNLSIDGVIRAQNADPVPTSKQHPESELLMLGDPTITGGNALAEYALFNFTQPQIATQTPAPGTLVNPASAVDLGIQEGPATQTVPAVSGLAQTDAETDIVAAGLLVGNITTEVSDTVPGGSVIRQKPVAGTHIMKNFKVDLVVSSTPGNRPPTITSTPITTANTGELYSYDVNATDPDAGDVLAYSLTTAPAGMSIDSNTGMIQWTPAPAQAGNPSVIVKVQDQDGLSATQGFTIAVSPANHAPVISSTPPAGVKAEKLYSYPVVATDPDAGDALTYTFASDIPSGMSIDATTGLLQWTPTAAQVGTHSGIIIKVSDQKGLFATQSIDITVKPANRAPSIGSTAPTVATENEPYIYAVQASDPDAGDTLSYSLPAAPDGMTINQNTGLISWTPASTQIGEHPVIVQVQDQDGLNTTQGYTVTVAVASVIVPNVEGATLAAAQAALTAAQLKSGNVLNLYDETVPAGLVLNQQPLAGASVAKNTAVDLIVSQGPAPVSVPSVVGFLQAAAESALLAAKLAVGTVTPAESDTIPAGIVISQAPAATTSVPKNTAVDLVVSSGPALISTPNVVGLDETAAEAALLAANLVVGAKSAVNSDTVPAGQVISQNPAAGVKLAKGSAVDLAVSSGPAAPEFAAIQVLPESPLLLTGETLAFSAFAILDDGTSQSLSGASWTSATPTVATIDANGVVTALAEGQTLISAKKGGVTGSVTLTVKAAAPGDVTPPDAAITAPVSDATITAPTDITGNASDANFLKYELALSPVGQNQFTVFKTGDTAVSNGVLGTLDPTLLLNDQYTLRLTVWDRRNNQAQSELRVQVAREQKVGNFTLAFQDVSVPMACMPITVTRVYDSRDKRQGDFGVGWRLDVKTMQLRESREMGSGWHVDLINKKIGFVTIPVYVLSSDDVHKVSLTLPDGHVEEFDLTASPTENQLFPISTVNLAYSPRPGTLGSLAPVGPTEWGLSGEQGTVEFIDSDVNRFDPQQYRYTAPDGSVYIIDKNAGVQSVQCINGQKLNFDANGISHSDGAGVAFTRDGQNRITTITDPMGNSHQYSYDSNGDLVQHSDPANQKTGFKYDFRHGLIEIDDPRGIKAVRNEYDANGRLIGNTDAAGKKITYNHDLAAKKETVTDRLGNSTTYEYDDKGNVLKQTGALGNVTIYAYDAVGNQLTKTDALGRTTTQDYDSRRNVLRETDPLGHVTRYTYHALNGVKTIQDPLGHVTTNDYDGNGNLLSTADPLGNVTTYGYDKGGIIYPGSGLMTSKTDALGNKTRYNYDAQGRMTTETDPQGHVTSYDYDANGNRIRETRTRTLPGGGTEALVTTFEYDNLNRLVKTIQPDGSTSRTVYNAIGKQAQSVDALGHVTHYEYDALSHLIKTIYPDGAFETSGYDAEGRRIESIDRAGRKTAYTYDALGRLTLTTYTDGTSSSTVYDQAGQVTASVDALGHVTSYTYDDAGRRTQVTNALDHVSRFVYDAAGNQSQVTDANGHVTTFVYDNGNRRTQVVYPDGTKDLTGYDALGRNISKTDQAGKLTQFAYDALGRLITVTDALGQITTYGYDERGNQLSQRDANGHTTTFAYDDMGRRISRTLPEGQTEHMAYNAAGNLIAKTDFNGKTTTYAYDELNRLITKTPDASLGEPAVTYDYTVSGQRAVMQDASGVTTYSYDVRDRLIEKATPQGTLTYTYNGAGQLDSIQSNHAGGVDLSYSYDALNRLAQVTDQGLGNANTTYSYDNAGSLAGYVYPNGVETTYTYNALNRLTDMHVAKAGTDVARYQYTLGATGNRLSVAKLSGRTVNYLYDDLYRLSKETISGVVTPTQNGEIAYSYDPVGNRLTRTSTVGGIANQAFSYNANDQLNTDAYDANGNTIGTDGKTYTYDGDNRLTSQNGVEVQIVYDGDGNRVAKTVGGVTTQYLVDTLNPTGYAQVLEEIESGSVVRRYSYGSDLISQSLKAGAGWQTYFYGYDGHGSVRFLTDLNGLVTDRYDYEGFGNLVNQEGTTANSYLYSGEQRDTSLGLDYLRARYYQSRYGRMIGLDSFEGNLSEAKTLHKYVYTANNPINSRDPSGKLYSTYSLSELSAASAIQGELRKSDAKVHLGPQTRLLLEKVSAKMDQQAVLTWARVVQYSLPFATTLIVLSEKPRRVNIFFPGMDTRETTLHIWDAIQGGRNGSQPFLLHKTSRQEDDWIHYTIDCIGNDPAETGRLCDEYPFASTKEGGVNHDPKPSTRLVPRSEQEVQGGFLRAFYGEYYCDIPEQDSEGPDYIKSSFLVVPNIASARTHWICANGRAR